MRVIRDKTDRQTDRTLCFMDEEVYTKVLQESRPDVKIDPFVTPRTFHPNPERYTYNFCIPFPSTSEGEMSTSARDEIYVNEIKDMLKPFVAQGLLPHDGYRINVPVIDREKDETQGIAFVTFHPSINKDVLANIRYLMDRGTWKDLNTCRVSWGRLSAKQANRKK
jgi:hypothetical protein